MQKVEHIGIAVKDLAVSMPLFERLFGSSCYKTETVESEKALLIELCMELSTVPAKPDHNA